MSLSLAMSGCIYVYLVPYLSCALSPFSFLSLFPISTSFLLSPSSLHHKLYFSPSRSIKLTHPFLLQTSFLIKVLFYLFPSPSLSLILFLALPSSIPNAIKLKLLGTKTWSKICRQCHMHYWEFYGTSLQNVIVSP